MVERAKDHQEAPVQQQQRQQQRKQQRLDSKKMCLADADKVKKKNGSSGSSNKRSVVAGVPPDILSTSSSSSCSGDADAAAAAGAVDKHQRPQQGTLPPTPTRPEKRPVVVALSPPALLLILLCCGGLAFVSGSWVRRQWMVWPNRQGGGGGSCTSTMDGTTTSTITTTAATSVVQLPSIPTTGLQQAPQSTYTFQQFGAGMDGVRSNSILLPHPPPADEQQHHHHHARGGDECPATIVDTDTNRNDAPSCVDPDKEATAGAAAAAEMSAAASPLSYPAGQHLLIDIEGVDAAFLNSEVRLATAMIELARLATSVPFLSYHCHGLHPTGVTCVGILPESHVSLHTWPVEGVILLDLFACGTSTVPLLPLLPSVKDLFGVPRTLDVAQSDILAGEEEVDDTVRQTSPPSMVWGLKRRGFRAPQKYNFEETDFHWTLGKLNLQLEPVASVRTKFQQIDIVDIRDDRFRSSPNGETPVDRTIWLDRILQSRTFGENSYHEALVHPALFTHKHPKRVVIIGGGEGATLREVLKHSTVEEVVMIEIDEQMVNVSREYLPTWSDCSNLVGSSASCFDDPRAHVHYQDAVSWFIRTFSPDVDLSADDFVDVIIMDAL
jgi:S-adenosylmethionine/arginine decarboxylase-like enzyme